MKKTAIVTGANRGIGFAIARQLGMDGYQIVLTGRKEQERYQENFDLLTSDGTNWIYVKSDIANKEDRERVIYQCLSHFGGIHVLVNNAGITKDGLLMRMKENDFDAVIDVNLKGTWNCMKHATKIMMKQRYGRIISMSSVVGVMGNAGQVNYSASKAGIIGMTMSLAREVGSRGITVNAVAPGFIQTAMTDVLPEDIKESMAKQIPLGTFGQVRDIANTVVFLASDDARYITGQTIHVDGGMAM